MDNLQIMNYPIYIPHYTEAISYILVNILMTSFFLPNY